MTTESERRQTERWLKVSTVCRRLDVRKATVYGWIEEGVFREGELMRLPNTHWRIRESAIIALEQRGRPSLTA